MLRSKGFWYWIFLYKLSYDNMRKIDTTIYGHKSIVWCCDLQHRLMASNQIYWWKNEVQIPNGCLDIALADLQCNCKGQIGHYCVTNNSWLEGDMNLGISLVYSRRPDLWIPFETRTRNANLKLSKFWKFISL